MIITCRVVVLDDFFYQVFENHFKRNTYEVKDNKPVETEQADQDYYRLLELLDEHLENYSIKDDEGVEHVVPENRTLPCYLYLYSIFDTFVLRSSFLHSIFHILPFDRSTLKDIEKAIQEANLGINPTNNGEMVILTLPELTEEKRRDYVKQAKTMVLHEQS